MNVNAFVIPVFTMPGMGLTSVDMGVKGNARKAVEQVVRHLLCESGRAMLLENGQPICLN